MSQVPATVTPCTTQELVDALRLAYTAQMGHPPMNHTLAVLCAQVALETGNMRSLVQWNLGNYKRGPGPDWCAFETFEYLGTPPVKKVMVCDFSAWPDLESAAEFFISGLYSRYPEAWSGAVAGDSAAFAHGLRLRGYYTAPEQLYAAGVERWRAFYEKLLGNDQERPAEPELAGGGILSLEGLLDAV
jgi:hypothetical protein